MPLLQILGIRGIPANHGGFETFAERLSLYLVSRGWDVIVYCQNSTEKKLVEKNWRGIRLIQVPTLNDGALGTIIFDLKSTIYASKKKGIVLTLGYNTAIFCLLYRFKRLTNLINMDGIEWRRQKWNTLEKAWLYLNERMGSWVGNHLIADHPGIKAYLANYVSSKKITVIPYGSEPVLSADPQLIKQYGLVPNKYALLIARPEPENSILEIVSAFSSQKRGFKLVVLGQYWPDVTYHQQVLNAASNEVIFPSAIYNKSVVNALRFYTRLYIHGHTVGGTNPSLVEALAAGAPILAHHNSFNLWVAGSGAHYFRNEQECIQQLDEILADEIELWRMKVASLARYKEEFSDNKDVIAYEALLKHYLREPSQVSQTNQIARARDTQRASNYSR